MIQPNSKYAGTIKDAIVPDVEVGKKPYLNVTIQTPEGDIDHRLYLSANAKQFTERVLLELGLTPAHLVSEAFWVDPGTYMNGLDCHIETVEEEYNGNMYTRVKWLNGPNGPHREVKPMPAERARGLASLFARPDYNAPVPPAVGGNDDIPF